MSKLIYVADDDENIRNLIATFLRSEGFEAEVFENGDELFRAFSSRPADMLIIDIMMPGTDGLALCSKIREKNDVPIIIVSARDSEIDRITGITIGSDDYLVKPFSPVELVARARAIFRRIQKGASGGDGGDGGVLRFGDIALSQAERSAWLKGSRLDLTPTEFALLAYLLKSGSRAVPRGELLKHVWGIEADIDTRAADDVIKRLRKKLKNSSVRIASVWGYGFKLEASGEE